MERICNVVDKMTFPDTLEEFVEQYKVVDTDGIYMSKGSELVPIFRIKQWCDHIFAMTRPEQCKDTINRQAAIYALWKSPMFTSYSVLKILSDRLNELPAAQPKIIFCKDCKHYVEYHKLCKGMDQYTCHMNPDDFCSHGEKREK